ncbi:hypothetical protein DBP18_08065 [Streptomyces sp. CS081A]|nr:hypothetical protein DBP18_08065 [Streptomyces sp. CS081A]
MRGDGPWLADKFGVGDACSPRARGWTQAVRPGLEELRLLPACAGMDPTVPTRGASVLSLSFNYRRRTGIALARSFPSSSVVLEVGA